MEDLAKLQIRVQSLEVATAENRLRGLSKEGEKAERATDSLTRTTRLLTKAFAGLAAVGALGKAASLTKDFNQSIADLSAITGATGKDLEYYREQAEEIGRTTSLSASQASAAFKLIASAKPDLLANAEALNEVTRNAVTLAEAAGIELPEAAKALGSALNQFHLDATKSSEVINLLAASSKLGTAEVSSVTEALKNVGPAANSLGIDLAETVAGIQALAKSGRDGAEAGTGLRQVLLKLEKTGSEKLSPSIVGLVGALKNLKAQSLSNAELMKIFGEEGFTAATALLSTVDVVEDLNKTLRDTDTATEQASIRMDTLAGDLKGLNSAVEGLAIGALGGDMDELQRSVVQLSTDGVNKLTENLDVLAGVGKVLATVLVAKLAGSATLAGRAAIVASGQYIAYQTALARFTGVSRNAAAAQLSLGLATKGASTALAFLGGPVGIAVLATGALYAFREELGFTSFSADKATASIDKLTQNIDKLTIAQAKHKTLELEDGLLRAKEAADLAAGSVDFLTYRLEQQPENTLVERQLIKQQAAFDTANQSVEKYKTAIASLSDIVKGIKKPEVVPPPSEGGGGDKKKPIVPVDLSSLDKAENALKRLNDKLLQQTETFGKTDAEVLKYRLTVGDLSDGVGALGEKGDVLRASIIEQAEAYDTLREATRVSNKEQADAAALAVVNKDALENLRLSLRTEEEVIAESYAKRLAIILDNTKEGSDLQLELKRKLDEELAGDDVLKTLDKMFASSMDRLGDQLGDFVTTGKADFKGLVDFMIADIARMAIKEGISSLLGSLGGSSGGIATAAVRLFGGGRAEGGPIRKDQFYLVGEEGPELIAPGVDGTVIPNNKLGGAASRESVVNNYNYNYNLEVTTPDANSFRRSSRQIKDSLILG